MSEGTGRLNPDETTLPDLFQAGGYATGAFGKWHNGTQAPYHPLDRGFDEFYGFTSGHWGHYFSPPLDHNRKQVKGQGYLTDDLTDHALRFIEEHHGEPFLCYVPFNTPHSPFYVDDNFLRGSSTVSIRRCEIVIPKRKTFPQPAPRLRCVRTSIGTSGAS